MDNPLMKYDGICGFIYIYYKISTTIYFHDLGGVFPLIKKGILCHSPSKRGCLCQKK